MSVFRLRSNSARHINLHQGFPMTVLPLRTGPSVAIFPALRHFSTEGKKADVRLPRRRHVMPRRPVSRKITSRNPVGLPSPRTYSLLFSWAPQRTVRLAINPRFRQAKKVTLQTIQFLLLYASVCNIRHIFRKPRSCSS